MNGALSCPHCGGPVEGGARHCGYCRGPVATVRCGGCYEMNFPESGFCTGCGRQLGLEPIPDGESFECPQCRRILDVFAGGPGRLYDCNRCGGQLVEHGLFRDLLERREICGTAVPRRSLARPSNDAPTIRYVPCPMCQALMNRQNFGATSGVIVDYCAKHGVWFDAGELPRVLEFVENGGLTRARRRQIEELEQARQALRVAAREAHTSVQHGSLQETKPLQHTDLGSPLTFSSPPAWSSGLWEDAKEGASTMLHDLGELLAKWHRPR
jgi:Zn-finger nucleic acid-binding protein